MTDTTNRVLPAAPFTTPMPKVKPPRRDTGFGDEVENGPLTTLLQERGVRWPLGCFAPGFYAQRCGGCGKSHMADKHAWRCLPCAISGAVAPPAPPILSSDVVDLLREACSEAGGQKSWAERHDLSPAYVSDVLSVRRDPGESVLAALGLEKVVTYRRRAS